MFYVIESNDPLVLAGHLVRLYKQETRSLFDEFVVITPTKVLGDYLEKVIARQAGVASLVTTQFWGQYQWQLIAKVLTLGNAHLDALGAGAQDKLSVPDVALLSQAVVRWRIFGHWHSQDGDGTLIETALADDRHPLHELLSGLAKAGHLDSQTEKTNTNTASIMDKAQPVIDTARLWQLSGELAEIYVKYLTLRPDWLAMWAVGEHVDVPALIEQKDAMASFYHLYAKAYQDANSQDANDQETDTDQKQPQGTTDADDQILSPTTPEWLQVYYISLERALAYLWQTLFGATFLYRERLEARFWQILDRKPPFDSMLNNAPDLRQILPKKLYLYTVQQLPQVELDFLQRLSAHIDVLLLHFNPSQEFWADTVDKNWLVTQRLIRPQSVYLKDYGHALLSRLGKESRETFAMLADMAGGAYDPEHRQMVVWQDDFVRWQIPGASKNAPNTLLNQLKNDILNLDDTGMGANQQVLTQMASELANLRQKTHRSETWQFDSRDDSLGIHSCHSLKRQLEIARLMIVRWLNTPNADGSRRSPKDIVVLLPDVVSAQALIESVFGDSRLSANYMDGFLLPAKITGVPDKGITELWQAITGFFDLTDGRFYYESLCAWLMLEPVYRSVSLSFEQMQRACKLLAQAGFVRGLDADHLKTTLHSRDADYRYSLAYALDRLVAGLLLAGEAPTTMFYPFVWQANQLSESDRAEMSLPVEGIALADTAIINGLCQLFLALTDIRANKQTPRTAAGQLSYLEEMLIKRYFEHYQGTPELLAVFDAMNGLRTAIRASRQADDHSDAASLHLPLSFVLESLGDKLAQQKISSEPSGAITFGRFGSLRGIDFELVIMLDMNLNRFPRSDRPNRLDLSKAGMKRRGDRINEDDDNGAFLEALFAARQACWIFYTGQAADGSSLLPASPVTELVQFLSNGQVAWLNDQAERLDTDGKLRDLIEAWLVTKHPALPFERALFEYQDHEHLDTDVSDADRNQALIHAMHTDRQKSLPPPSLWVRIYEQLSADQDSSQQDVCSDKNPFCLPDDTDLLCISRAIDRLVAWAKDADSLALSHGTGLEQVIAFELSDVPALAKFGLTQMNWQALLAQLPSQLRVFAFANGLSNLGRYYLHGKTLVRDVDEVVGFEEPIDVDGLGRWQIGNTLLRGDDTALYYGNVLPAGMARTQALKDGQKTLATLKDTLATHLSKIGMTDDTDITLTSQQQLMVAGISLTADLPDQERTTGRAWVNLSLSRLSAKYLLRAWLLHNLWQASGADKLSIWQFQGVSQSYPIEQSSDFVCFGARDARSAKLELIKWLGFLALARHIPVVLTPTSALSYVHLSTMDTDLTDQKADEEKEDTDKALQLWRTTHALGAPSQEQASHPTWQQLLVGADSKRISEQALSLSVLYHTLYQALHWTSQ